MNYSVVTCLHTMLDAGATVLLKVPIGIEIQGQMLGKNLDSTLQKQTFKSHVDDLKTSASQIQRQCTGGLPTAPQHTMLLTISLLVFCLIHKL